MHACVCTCVCVGGHISALLKIQISYENQKLHQCIFEDEHIKTYRIMEYMNCTI